MQKMNSSTAVILLYAGLCGTKGSTLTAFSPGISAGALSAREIHSKTMFELQLTGRCPLVFRTQGRAVASLGDSRSPHHKAETSINTGHKAPTPGSLFLTLSPHCTLPYFGLVQPEESSSPHSSI